MSKPINILVVEDSEDDYFLLLRELKKSGHRISGSRVETEAKLQQALEQNTWDMIISDNNLPSLNAPRVLEISRQKSTAPFIIVSGSINESDAVNAMRMGASDYIFKGNMNRLLPAFKREIVELENRRQKEKAENALLKSEEQFKALADSIDDIFFALNHHLKCIYWNNVAAKKTGISPEDALNNSFTALFPKLPQAAIKTIQEAIRHKIKSVITLEQNDPDATYTEMICYPYNGGASIIMKDITQAKKTALKLKKVNIELETFMYRLSHDLKGPVASILGLVDLAKKDLEGETAEQYCNLLSTSAKNLQEVLESLLDITKIKTGDINAKHLSLKGVTKKIINRLYYRIEHTEATINYPEEDIVVFSDDLFVGSILQNLIENGIKYGGNYNEKPRVDISWESDNETVTIYVSDNGSGIPEHLQHKIFEMFYRASELNSGSGLGLYIVKSAAEAIGGTVILDEPKDRGCTFRVKFDKIKSEVTSKTPKMD